MRTKTPSFLVVLALAFTLTGAFESYYKYRLHKDFL